MTAISSLKPFEKSLEVAENQMAAKNSWEPMFDWIFYLGKPEPLLDSAKTRFVETEDFPRIQELLAVAAECPGWSCLVNADIYLSPIFLALEPKLDNLRAKVGLSRRFQMRPNVPLDQTAIEDWGLDIFVAKQELWQQAIKEIPEHFRIGHNLWDTWMVAFLMHKAGGSAVDFTPCRAVFHPLHEQRQRKYEIARPVNDPYFDHVTWPARLVKI